MRAYLYLDRGGWLYQLDHRKVILIAFLLRFIFAAAYDVSVSVSGKDIILPDSKFYSVRGWYIAYMLNGYDRDVLWRDKLPSDPQGKAMFYDAFDTERGRLPSSLKGTDESQVFSYLVGLIYFIFGYFPLAIRTFNIGLSIVSAYLLFKIAQRYFGKVTANLFLLIALFLPTQMIYSITLSRDMLRMFLISLILWIIYGGVICSKRHGK